MLGATPNSIVSSTFNQLYFSYCSVSNSTYGYSSLIGWMTGEVSYVSDCYGYANSLSDNSCSYFAHVYMGGTCYFNNLYNSDNGQLLISATNDFGGICEQYGKWNNAKAYVSNSFVGALQPTTNYGSRIGWQTSNGQYTNNYANSTINPRYSSTTGKNTPNGESVSALIYNQQGFWDGTGVSGTTYLSWDFNNTWYWDSTNNLPNLQVFKPAPSVNISDGTTWSNGTPYVYDTEWLQGEKLHVYTSSGWTEKV